MIVTPRYVHTSPFSLEAMSLELPVLAEAHPNRLPFRGVLTRLDEPSTRPPNGSQGHRVLIPRAVAAAAGDTVVGMPIDCSWNLQDHDKRQNIGVITGWDIQGHDFVVEGHLYGKNFPEEIQSIQAQKDQLGMSYEVGDVDVVDTSAPIWELSHFVFTGAAILRKDAAAYAKTAIAAKAEEDAQMEKTVLDELHMLGAKIDGLQASLDADADAEAASAAEADASAHDQVAATALAAAKRARDDMDEEDAARHDEAVVAAHTKAFMSRMKASQWHAARATACRAAGEEDAAQEHDAAAARLTAAAEASQQAAAAVQAQHATREDAAATRDGTASSEDDTLSAAMLSALLKASKGDDGVFASMMAAALKAKRLAAQHDDEDEDRALMRKMMKEKGMKASGTGSDLVLHRRLRTIEASMELLTDTMKKVTTLLTDLAHPRSGLATDHPAAGPQGGQAPTRRSMQGAGGQDQWVDKFAGTRNDQQGKMTEAEATRQMVAEGVTDTRQQMARLVELHRQGLIVH